MVCNRTLVTAVEWVSFLILPLISCLHHFLFLKQLHFSWIWRINTSPTMCLSNLGKDVSAAVLQKIVTSWQCLFPVVMEDFCEQSYWGVKDQICLIPVALVVHFGNTEVVLAPLRHTFNSVCSLYVACAHLERGFFFSFKRKCDCYR